MTALEKAKKDYYAKKKIADEAKAESLKAWNKNRLARERKERKKERRWRG